MKLPVMETDASERGVHVRESVGYASAAWTERRCGRRHE